MRDRFDIFGAVIRIRKLSLLLVVTLRMPNSEALGVMPQSLNGSDPLYTLSEPHLPPIPFTLSSSLHVK